MKTFVIILHFGDISVTKNCIQSLYKKEKEPLDLIVVNNDSKKLFSKDISNKKTIVINNGKNLGFAKGINVGIRYALSQKAEYVLLLNNDTIIKNPILAQMLTTFKNFPSAGIVAPCIEFIKNGKTCYDVGGSIHYLTGRTSHKEVAQATNLPLQHPMYVSGCCMMIMPNVFKKIGFFDEQFFLYYEDVDFCLRAKKAGFDILLDPKVTVYHHLSTSVGKVSYLAAYHQIRSAILFGKKYFSSFPKNICNKLFIIFQTFLFLKASLPGGLGALKALLNAGEENKQ